MANKSSITLTKQSQELINKLAKEGNFDLKPAFNTIGESYRKETKQIFDKQQPRDFGLKWPALSPAYAARKAREYPGAPILVRTGSLKESMIRQGAKGNISLIGNTKAVFGSAIFYGKFHDEGTGKMPKRNFSEPSNRRFNIWQGIIERAIANNFIKNGVTVRTGSILS